MYFTVFCVWLFFFVRSSGLLIFSTDFEREKKKTKRECVAKPRRRRRDVAYYYAPAGLADECAARSMASGTTTAADGRGGDPAINIIILLKYITDCATGRGSVVIRVLNFTVVENRNYVRPDYGGWTK